MKTYDIPLIIRGKVIDDEPVSFSARRGELEFRTPDVKKHIKQLVMRNSVNQQDLYKLSLDNIIEYLDALSYRISPEDNPHIRQAIEINALTSTFNKTMNENMFRNMPSAIRRDAIEEVVDQMFGRACLDGWERRKFRDREVSVRAFGGRTVHMNAGNGAAIVMFSTVFGSILRCDNIVKSPSNDPYTAAAMAQTMIEMDPDHPLTKHLSVAYWKGGDTEFEEKFYKPTNIDTIVAWGGFASMKHIRNYLRPGMDLVALDPKLSASVIGPEAFEDEDSLQYVAKQIGRDVGLYNQAACVSTRTVYVASGTNEKGIENINRLGQLVFDEIQGLPDTVSCPAPDFDPVLRQEINGIRGSEYFKVIGGKGAEGAVIVSQEDEQVDFSERLDCRVVNLVPVDKVEDCFQWITLDTQTIAVYPESLKSEISIQLALRGGQRITSLGCTGFEAMAAPHDSIELGRRIARWVIREDFPKSVIDDGSGFVQGLASA